MSEPNINRLVNGILTAGGTLADSGSAISLSKTAVTLPAMTVSGALVASSTLAVTGNTTLTGNLLPTVATATATGNGTTAGAATATGKCGVITTESLSTAQNAIYTLTLTLTGLVTAGVPILFSVSNGGNSAGTPMPGVATRTDANTLTITVINKHATAVAFNGTLIISYWILG